MTPRRKGLWLVGLEVEIWRCGQERRFDSGEEGRGLVWILEWCLGKERNP